jgi:hypothetical protein
MTQKGWKSKGKIEPRRSPRKRGKTCGRPFKAPRPVSEVVDRDSDVVLVTTDADHDKDSQVEEITETENERDLRGRRRSALLSERGPHTIVAEGEVIDDISSDDKDVRLDTPNQTTIESDTTGSTPEICESPCLEVVETATTYKARNFRGQTYKGITHVDETEQQDKSSDSEDEIPVATMLRREEGVRLTDQQIKDCREGSKDERAIGITVAKLFGGVEFKGTIDSFRTARQRNYYHVVYTDGDDFVDTKHGIKRRAIEAITDM